MPFIPPRPRLAGHSPCRPKAARTSLPTKQWPDETKLFRRFSKQFFHFAIHCPPFFSPVPPSLSLRAFSLWHLYHRETPPFSAPHGARFPASFNGQNQTIPNSPNSAVATAHFSTCSDAFCSASAFSASLAWPNWRRARMKTSCPVRQVSRRRNRSPRRQSRSPR